MDLRTAIGEALEQISVAAHRRLDAPATIQATGGPVAVNCDEAARAKWLALDRTRDVLTVLGRYPLTLEAPDGSTYQLASALAVKAAVDALVLEGLARETAAVQARAAVRAAQTVEEVDAAVAAYLEGP